MPTDQFLQVTVYFGAPGLKRGFLCTFPACRTTAVQGLIRCHTTCHTTELDTSVWFCRFKKLGRQMSE